MDGRLAVYDVAVKRAQALETLDVTGLDEAVWCLELSRGQRRPSWLAVSNIDVVAVYKVSRKLVGDSTDCSRGKAAIERMVAAAKDNA